MTTALYMRNCIAVFLLLLIPCISKGQTQTYFQYKTDEATLVFFDKNLSLIPSISQKRPCCY